MNATPLSQIASMRAGTVLESIVGTFTKIYDERKAGTNTHGEWSLQNAKFRDDHGTEVTVQFKNQDLIPQTWAGHRVEIVTVGDSKSKGISVDEYQGAKRLMLHPTIEINWLQDSAPATRTARPDPPASQQTRHDPPARQDGPPATTQRAAGPPAHDPPATRTERPPVTPDGKHIPIFGATCGMAINNAVEILSQGGHSLDYFRSPDFSKDVWCLASDLIRVSQALERGVLAPAPKERRSQKEAGRPEADPDNPATW